MILESIKTKITIHNGIVIFSLIYYFLLKNYSYFVLLRTFVTKQYLFIYFKINSH